MKLDKRNIMWIVILFFGFPFGILVGFQIWPIIWALVPEPFVPNFWDMRKF